MRMIKVAYFMMFLLCIFAETSFAQQLTDARSLGMGGCGVASADYKTALFHNPALAAKYEESDDIGLALPSVSGVFYDKDNLVEDLDDLKDAIDLDAGSSIEEIQKAKQLLTGVNDSTLNAQVSAGASVVVPADLVTFGFFAVTHVDSFGFGDIGDIDADVANAIAGNPLQSQGGAFLFNATEYGVTFAKKFTVKYGDLYVGVSPKLQEVRTMKYVQKVDSFDSDDVELDDFKHSEFTGNVDLGVAFTTHYNVTFAVTAQNLVPQSFDIDGNGKGLSAVKGEYKLNPMVTVGTAYTPVDWITLSADVELTKRERFDNVTGTINSFSNSFDDTQFVGVGAEINAFDWGQLRAGYRYDMLGTIPGTVTAGLGFSPFGAFHLDVAGAYGGSGVYGGAVELGVTF
ncbi:conjugal transfer protein TraF [Halodesulfovibrio aestuarii]|uniref:conjugal transfer protein TraF n=1 Tax=Halodesulfovibrio aestuarii TaxID=126333 RepID=UPI003D33BE51